MVHAPKLYLSSSSASIESEDSDDSDYPSSLSSTSDSAITDKPVPSESDSESDNVNPSESVHVPFSFTALSRQEKLILCALGFTDFTAYLAFSLMGPFFPGYAHSRGVSDDVIGLIFGIVSLVQCLFSPIAGCFIPKIGARFSFISGHFFSAGCVILFGFVQYIPSHGNQFIVFCFVLRIAMAIGVAFYITASFSITAVSFPHHVSAVFGLLETFESVGRMVGPTVGGFLFEFGGYAMPFFTLGAIMLLWIPVVQKLIVVNEISRYETSDEESVDLPSTSPRHGRLACNILSQSPVLVVVGLIVCLGSAAMECLEPILEEYLASFRLGSFIIGAFFLIRSACYGLSAPFWGCAADRLSDSKPIMVLGFLICGISYFLLAQSPWLQVFPSTIVQTAWWAALWLSIIGLSGSLASIPVFSALMSYVDVSNEEDSLYIYAFLAGFWSSCYSLGEFIGPVISGVVTGRLGFNYTVSYAAAVCWFCAFLLLVLCIVERLCRQRRRTVAACTSVEYAETTPLLANVHSSTLKQQVPM